LSLLDHPMRGELLWVLGAFSWFSRNGNARAAELIEKRWSKGMALRSAQASASAWALDMIGQSQKQPTKRGPGRYSVRNRSSGFAVVVLRSAAELAEEGRVMDHCVGSYAHDVMHGRCLIFGVRWNGQRVATLEVRKGGRREYPHQIVQLQGPGNTKVPPEIRGRINSWFLQHVSNPVAGAMSDLELVSMDERKWAEFLAPYREAVSTAFEGECVPAPQYVKNAALLLQQENRW
ncbi:MAG: PcfJ domain-containing protein, partial [Pseudomonadota bacterium]